MLDDLDWATADLEQALTLYERALGADVVVDECWWSGVFRWHLRSWRYRLPDGTSHGPIVPGLWEVSLTAVSRTASWSFSPTGNGWAVLDYSIRGVAKPPAG